MALPTGTFNTASSGRLQVVFRGTWLVNETDWGAGDWQLSLRAYVGTGSTRKTSLLGTNTGTATIEVPYVGGTNVAVGFEYDSHSYGGAGTICATDLRIACHLLPPLTGGPPVVTFAGLLQQLRDASLPITNTPQAAPWLTDIGGSDWYVRPIADFATLEVEAQGNLNSFGRDTVTLAYLIDPASIVAWTMERDDWLNPVRQVAVDVLPDGYTYRVLDGIAFGSYTITLNVVPTATDGTTYATAWAGVDSITWGSILPGDTLWVCGTHYDRTLSVGASGTAGAWVKIRLDYLADPGRLYQSRIVNPLEWLDEGGGEYSIETLTVNNMLWEDGQRVRGCGTTSRCRVAAIESNYAADTFQLRSIRIVFTGKPVFIAFDFSIDAVPVPLLRNTVYYLIVLSAIGTYPGTVRYTCKLAASYADALANTAIDLEEPLTPSLRWYVWITDTGGAFLDPLPGSLGAGEFAVNPATDRLHYKPSSGGPGSHVLLLSNDKTSVTGSCIHFASRSYVRVMGAGLYGGLFGSAPVGVIGYAHHNGISSTAGSNIVIDGLEVHNTRSGFVFQGTEYGVGRNCRVRDVGWHATGSEQGANAEPYQIVERCWISRVGLGHDFGDTQALVTNPQSNQSIFRRNYVDTSGRNNEVLNSGCVVIDNSTDVTVYRNWLHAHVGEVIAIGSRDYLTSGQRVVSNVITRTNATLSPSNIQQHRQPAVLRQNLTNAAAPGISTQLFAGNLIFDSDVRPPPTAYVSTTGALIYLRASVAGPINTLQSFTRNAVGAVQGWVFTLFRVTSGNTLGTIEAADYNLYCTVREFARVRVGLTDLSAYTGGQIKGGLGTWQGDTGLEEHSTLAVRSPEDTTIAPTTAQLEFLRDFDGLDSYDRTHRPGLHQVGTFPTQAAT